MSHKSLKYWFIGTWFFGFVVYDVGMSTGSIFSLLTNAPMAILHAFGIFVLDSDVSEIQAKFHESWIFMAAFSLSHLLAAIVSTLFVLKHFGFNIQQGIRMFFARFGRKVDDIYVFWGIDESSCNLIDSIKKKYDEDIENKLGDYMIIAVRTNRDDDESPESRTGFGRIFDLLSIKTSELDKLKELKCLTTCTYADLSKINIPKDEGTSDVLEKFLKLNSLRIILKNRVKKNIHMFFLSDEENDNLHSTLLLLKDKTLKEFSKRINQRNDYGSLQLYSIGTDPSVKENVKVKSWDIEQGYRTEEQITIRKRKVGNEKDDLMKRHVIYYCHTRYNSIHRVIEDQHRSSNEIVRIIDSSHINVEMLKEDRELLPVNYVEVENDATVSTKFHALVVGFSEVGQDSARFLYEFGSFVKNGSRGDFAERSDFHLDVVDRNMSELAGTFVANAPAIMPSLTFIPGERNRNALIALHELDCRSVKFYEKLAQWIKTLNYIVIATDDDELNLSLGVRIFKIAARYREGFDRAEKLCILVRTHHDADGHAARIINYYNRLWAAERVDAIHWDKKDKVYKKVFRQSSVMKEDEMRGPLYLFGLDTTTYTFENIIDDSHEKKAVEYKERYEASTEEKKDKKPDNDKEEDKAWYKKIRELLSLNGEIVSDGVKKEYSPTYGALMKLRRTLGQDMANSLHALTKRILIEKALTKLNKLNFDWGSVERKNTTFYTIKGTDNERIDEAIQRLLMVLAQTEHLRWNASHEILGYTRERNDIEYKDEMKLHHGCLTDWDKLNDEKRSYDFNVVDLTIEDIINQKKEEKKDEDKRND
jgi:hypothetical protein